MNAYELAKKLEWYTNYDEFVEAGAMLRQQADRIAKLESYLEAYKTRVVELEKQIQIRNTPPIEPDFLMQAQGQKFWGNLENQCHGYTAPQIKELSDAEISQISHRYHYTYNPDYVGFARAILKKASEK
jgi:hypothetical protein